MRYFHFGITVIYANGNQVPASIGIADELFPTTEEVKKEAQSMTTDTILNVVVFSIFEFEDEIDYKLFFELN